MRKAFALSIPLLLSLAACTYDNGDAHHLVFDPGPSSAECGPGAAQAAIDTDRSLEIDAGQGAGVYVEYAAGGHWHVRTSCDSDRQDVSCRWDVLVYSLDQQTLSNFAGEDLEPNDILRPYPDHPSDTFQLVAHTTSDIDGFTFDADPGVAVTVDALLNGACALPYFFWIGDGALHPGSPSNPLTLVPSAD